MKTIRYFLCLALLLGLSGCDTHHSQEAQQLAEMMKHPLQEAQKAVDATEVKVREQHKAIESY